ncbi:hypothetical protein [Streptomyces sp900129855]|uniref:Uncharacterized protein n=1 Tax=Streptomyces sp. 900129855 TaxID=3155129 RepID=A0ABV2ZRC2_9ACTN
MIHHGDSVIHHGGAVIHHGGAGSLMTAAAPLADFEALVTAPR